MRSTFEEYQASEDPAEKDKIMHSTLTTDSGLVLMAADTPNSMDYTPGTNYSVSLSGDDDAELRGYWEKLSEGGTVGDAIGAGTVGRQLRNVHRQIRRELAGQHLPSQGVITLGCGRGDTRYFLRCHRAASGVKFLQVTRGG